MELTYSDPCGCRRCYIHDDPGGCTVLELAWLAFCWMAGADSSW